MKVAFIKANVVVEAYPSGAFVAIGQANFRKDWQCIMVCADVVEVGWLYDEKTKQLTAPE